MSSQARMLRLLTLVDRALPDDVAATQTVERTRARTVVITSVSASVLCAVSFVAAKVFDLMVIAPTLWIGLFGFALVPVVYHVTRSFRVASLLFNALAFAEMAIAVGAGGGMGSVYAAWLPMYPAVMLAVFGYQGALVALVLMFALIGGMLYGSSEGWIPPPHYPLQDVPIDLSVIVVVSSLIYLITAYAREIALLDLSTMRSADELALARAEEASRAKSGILTSVSQELRTPMTGLLSLADVLSETPLDARQADWVRSMRTTGAAILALLDDLLDTARLEAGAIQLRNRAFRPPVLAHQVMALFEPQATAKGLTLSVDVAEDVPARLRGDPARIRQVLINLVANAVNYTEQGTITMTVRSRGEKLVIWVSDTGVGIARDRLDVLFAAPSDDPATRAQRGMGLSITRLLVQAMGGTLEVESRLGAGSTFWVHLPLVNASAEDEPTESTSESMGNASQLRVLVAEDDPVNRMVIRAMLESLGHAVQVIDDGETIVESARVFAPDIIIVDVRMRRVGGIEATKRLRADTQFVALPILAMSANDVDDNRRACEDAGVTGFLAKPVAREALAAALRA